MGDFLIICLLMSGQLTALNTEFLQQCCILPINRSAASDDTNVTKDVT
jgi:hypothetical protein